MAKLSDAQIPSLLFAEQATAPATPAAGYGRLYVKGTGVFFKGDDGVEIGPFAASSGGGAAELLAAIKYDPATKVDINTTSATFADADATNLAVSFTAPATGKVLVRLNGYAVGAAGSGYSWGLRSGTTDLDDRLIMYNAYEGAKSATFHIAGLTAGTAYTYKWSHALTLGTNVVKLQAGGLQGPVTMEVWSAP